jgi:hypothetical protein
VLRHRLRWPTMTTRDNCSADDGGTTTAEPMAATDVVVPAVTPPPPPLTAAMATPRGPSTSTPRLTPFRCGLDWGGQHPVATPIGCDSRRCHLWSSSAAGRPDLCVAPGASTSDGMDTVDDPWCVTPRVTFSLITFIRDLIMHQVLGSSSSNPMEGIQFNYQF